MKEQIELQVFTKQGLKIRTFEVEPYMKKPHYDEVFEKETSDLNMDGLYYKLDFINRSQKPTVFEGRRFKHLIEFDGRCITLATTDINEDGQYGTYSTCIPLSSVDYYNEHGGKGNADVFYTDTYFKFTVTDDYGKMYFIYIPSEQTEKCENAFEFYKEYGWMYETYDVLGGVYKGLTNNGESPLKLRYKTYLDHKNKISNTSVEKLVLLQDYQWETIKNDTCMQVVKMFKDVVLVRSFIALKTKDLIGITNGIIKRDDVIKFYEKLK